MKVVLSAFGRKLQSGFLDWPENTGHDIYLVMAMESPMLFNLKESGIPRTLKKARFQFTGNHFVNGAESARDYRLVDVS